MVVEAAEEVKEATKTVAGPNHGAVTKSDPDQSLDLKIAIGVENPTINPMIAGQKQ